MAAVLRAHTTGEARGFMKILVEASSDHILGITMLGAEAGEVLSVVQTAMWRAFLTPRCATRSSCTRP